MKENPSNAPDLRPEVTDPETFGLYEELSEILDSYYSLEQGAIYPASVRDALSSLKNTDSAE